MEFILVLFLWTTDARTPVTVESFAVQNAELCETAARTAKSTAMLVTNKYTNAAAVCMRVRAA